MNATLPKANAVDCPEMGVKLTYVASGGAFLDGCYMNTTRTQLKNEETGEEAQHYLYMWKHACAFTKWVPSNQFMYGNIDYNAETMTLERFGFIGMNKRCFWGSIGLLWKRPLPVEQILPNITSLGEQESSQKVIKSENPSFNNGASKPPPQNVPSVKPKEAPVVEEPKKAPVVEEPK